MPKTITYIVDGDTATLTETWTGDTTKMNKMLQAASQWYYEYGLATQIMDGENIVSFDNLTLAQKKIILLEGDTQYKIDAAWAQYNADKEAEKIASLSTPEEEFNMQD